MMDPNTRYTHSTNVHNLQAAEQMVPFMMELFRPKSVTDVGCGLGSWLKVFQNAGVSDITGYDGAYVDVSRMYIDPSFFIPVDLELPIQTTRRSDLALCLEVAEHLKPSAAGILVSSLVNLSDTIIFSAAIPGQGGQNHINEQWPDWWAEHFKKHGYFLYDVFRNRFWNNPGIEWWYRQNIFLVTTPEKAAAFDFTVSSNAYVHPDLYQLKLRKINDYETGSIRLAEAATVFTNTIKRVIAQRMGNK